MLNNFPKYRTMNFFVKSLDEDGRRIWTRTVEMELYPLNIRTHTIENNDRMINTVGRMLETAKLLEGDIQ